MAIRVNEAVIDEDAISAEAANHADTPSPRHAAACALAIRELLLQRAVAAGLAQRQALHEEPACEDAIELLLAREAPVPQPTDDECRRFYQQRGGRFTFGERVELSHILFAVTPNAPVEAIRGQAEATLREACASPERFAELAASLSNCPSAAQGGRLGEIGRGNTVPEFERAVFGAAPGVLPRLVNTRYGFHVVQITRVLPGVSLDFDLARPRIERILTERVRAKAAEQYVRVLAARASIAGIDLGAAATPLVQ